MNPRLDRVYQEDEKMMISFTNTNYSIVNALRRTILSDIPVVSFTTFPHDENKCEIFKNTSNLNNEIVKDGYIEESEWAEAFDDLLEYRGEAFAKEWEVSGRGGGKGKDIAGLEGTL